MSRLVVTTAAVLVAVLVLAELAMRPPLEERILIYGLFGGSAVGTALLGWGILRITRRARSLRTAVLLPPVAAVSVATLAVGGAALTMFLSPHDLRLVLVALALGVGLGWVLGAALVRPLAADLGRLAETAARVAEGNLSVTTGIERCDEVGRVARAVDAMIARLAEARATRERHEQARKTFLTAVGHDLRTPLTSLQAAVEALQDGMAPDPDRYLRSMVGDLKLLRGLVDDLFVLARIEAGDLALRPVPVDLAELSDEVLDTMRPLAERRRVELALSAEPPLPIRVDPQAVARVIRNLVDNAVRHAPVGSTVVVEAARRSAGIVLRVVDEGPGFPDDRGYPASDSGRSHSDGGRSGLGLPIARGLVEAQGGTIWIEDGPGGRVAFRLPSDVTSS